jgi:hypothetical protein
LGYVSDSDCQRPDGDRRDMRRCLVLLAVTILITAGGCAPRKIGRVRATAVSAPELEAGLSVAAALVDKGTTARNAQPEGLAKGEDREH